LALASAFVLGCLYLVVLCPDFFSTQNPELTDARQAFIPVQPLHFFDRGRFSPWVPEIVGKRNPLTLRMEWTQDPNRKVSVQFFASGTGYRVLGLFETQVHLLGSVDPGQRIFLLGSDRLGRDQWSRIMYGTQTSMTVGLVAVALSVVLGVVLGGISGYFGGLADQVIQRLIELLQSVPTIPIWLALSAALPRDWTPTQVFFAITMILSLVGWTTLGREVRGRFLALREEDFVLAAKLAGCSQLRIILRHMVPTFLSHIIATSSLAIPVMIISETSLSFLGLGIRPPAISWGVLLQEAQNIQTLALAPWLLIPGLVVIVAVLAFNLVGDGLRDASDPYSR
jgi:peptide/nickel transport system permease protein